MATKSEINMFINTENSKAITEINKKYSMMIDTRREELLEERGFKQKAMALQIKINELHAMTAKLESEMQHDELLGLETWNMLARKLSEFAGESRYFEELRYQGHYDKTNVPLISEERKKLTRETNKQYDNLRTAVKQMNASKAIVHLKELGFDVTPLNNNTTETALLALVDKTKLFYPRKTEEANQENPATESQEEAE